MPKQHAILAFIVTVFSLPALAVEYSCEVTRKLDVERDYTAEQISKFQYSNRLEESSDASFVSRCSFAQSVGRVTCDRYKIDRVEFDANARIKKFYVFRSQFDFQLFPDLSFVENTGRGGVSYGKCKVVSP